MNSSTPRRPVRWWPALLILIAAVGRFAYLLMSETEDQQQRTFALGAVVLIAGFLLFLWAMLFARFSGWARLKILGGGLAAMVLFFTLFRIEEVSGNMVPILSFRWAGDVQFEGGGGSGAVEATENDYPQFLGKNRTASVENLRLDPDWQARPPREVWRRSVGAGQSSFAVVGNAAVTFEQREGQQVVVRYDLESGEVVWSHGVDGVFESVIGGNGPRSTPTVRDGVVYAFGPNGSLRALDLADGKPRWVKSAAEDLGTKRPEWGFASSPLVFDTEENGRLVVVSLGAEGASLVAFGADSGQVVWQAGSDRVGYSSPRLVEIAGTPQILIFNGASVSSHAPSTGAVLWTHPWSGQQPNVAMPLVLQGDRVLISSGYGIGAALLQIAPSEDAGWQVSEQWTSPRLKAKFTNPVIHEGYVFGLDDGVMTCLDPTDGTRCWKRGRYGHGQNILVGDSLLVQSEDGEVLLLEASSEEHRELGQISALTGKSWNAPALAGKYLLVRNSKEAVCYELATL
ncbi:MAG: PQQ-binding-like beta-propeller repeat protein [Acidobacteriota bacterium]